MRDRRAVTLVGEDAPASWLGVGIATGGHPAEGEDDDRNRDPDGRDRNGDD